jgi:hypothetical protein
MKDMIFQVLRFTAKLTVFYLFLLVFGAFMFYVFIKPAYRSLMAQQLFTVEGVSKSNFTPDLAKVSAGANFEGVDVRALKTTADTNLQGATNALLALGIPQEKITSEYALNPKYDKDYIEIIGYRATLSLEVKTKDFTQIDKILEIALNNNFNRVNGVSFIFEDPVALRESLRLEAIEAAKAKAQTIATESGLHLGNLVNVYEGNYYGYDQYQVNSFSEDASLDLLQSKESTSYNPGESEMTMQVTLVYEVN